MRFTSYQKDGTRQADPALLSHKAQPVIIFMQDFFLSSVLGTTGYYLCKMIKLSFLISYLLQSIVFTATLYISFDEFNFSPLLNIYKILMWSIVYLSISSRNQKNQGFHFLNIYQMCHGIKHGPQT